MAALCGLPTIQYSAGSARLYLIVGSLGPPKSSTQTASRSLQSFCWAHFDRLTDYVTASVTTAGIYVRSTVMRCNHNCIISRLLDWFPCFYRQTEKCNRRQQTSLRMRCGIARLTIYFLNLSPVNAKLISLSYVHASMLPSCDWRSCVINVRRMACDCRLTQKFHKTTR